MEIKINLILVRRKPSLLDGPKILYHFAWIDTQRQNKFPQFSNDVQMASNFKTYDFGDILRATCLYFFDSGPQFSKNSFFELTCEIQNGK